MNKEQAHAAMLTKIALSGLDAQDAKKLKFVAYPSDHTLPLSVIAGGFTLPYFELSGASNCFQRFRLLEAPPASGGFASAAAKPPKYLQQAGTKPGVYLPPYEPWTKILAEPVPLILTEGELKAACATKLGFITLGLGGVWSFRDGDGFLPILEAATWKKRTVYIVFDSDAVTNPQVLRAENALAKELFKRGATPFIVRLKGGAQKVGLDDYLMAHSSDEFNALLAGAPPWGSSKELHELNEEVLYVRDPGLVMRLETMQRISPEAFQSHQFANRTVMVEVPTPKGVKKEEKSLPREWIKWASRAEVEKAVYEPGAERFHGGCLNIWPGWGCEPIKGDIGPWKKLLEYLFKGLPLERRYFEQWVACPLQNPGIKMFVAAVMWGRVQGTGKSLVGNTLKHIYGKNFAEIDNDKLQNRGFNAWSENKQFVLGDEVTAGEKRGTSEYLKNLITRETAEINIKYVPSFTIRDCINWYLTSNKPDAYFMEDTDRRTFVNEVVGAPLPHEFYLDYIDWLKNRGGPSALFHHLLHLNLNGFNPHAPALNTKAKDAMRSMSKSALGAWVQELREVPDNVLRMGNLILPWTLATTADLMGLYDSNQRTGTTLNALSRELAAAGLEKVHNGGKIRIKDGRLIEMWVVRHKSSVKNPKPAWLATQYDKEHK